MGEAAADTGTVKGRMTDRDVVQSGDEPKPQASDPTPPARAAKGARAGGRSLNGRTLAICVVVALIGALAAALITAIVLDDDGKPTDDANTMALAEKVDTDKLLGVGLLTIDGKATTLAAHLGDKPMVVNLWAQNCVPCIDEMPLIEQARVDNPDVDFLGIDTQDPNLERAKRLAQQTGIKYPWVRDPKGDFIYEARAALLPTTLLITPDGEIRAGRSKVFKTQSELQTWIDRYRP